MLDEINLAGFDGAGGVTRREINEETRANRSAGGATIIHLCIR